MSVREKRYIQYNGSKKNTERTNNVTTKTWEQTMLFSRTVHLLKDSTIVTSQHGKHSTLGTNRSHGTTSMLIQ